ncbi:thermonuclease family protein (plasmid) [Sinorhizobium chiapasense]|uniref:thermonuclease family protein n=1 Tax=Sinorhizobium chiapasense TaxID=501572 RepID=UPI002FDF93D1
MAQNNVTPFRRPRKAGGDGRKEIRAERKRSRFAYPLRHGRPIAIVGLAIIVVAGILSACGPSNLTSLLAFANISTADSLSASFSICGDGRHINCVVDGDTFWFDGEKIRIADIDTPELSPPRCEAERLKGEAAKARLLALLNAGTFSLSTGVRDEDKYGRKLRTVTRAGRSLGSTLVHEGLARSWDGERHGWCG